MCKFRILLSAAAVLLIGATDPPRDWYFLSFEDGDCIQASTRLKPDVATPDLYRKTARRNGRGEHTDVIKNNQGQVVTVIITTQGGGRESSAYWFPSLNLCKMGLIAAHLTGNIPDEADLK